MPTPSSLLLSQGGATGQFMLTTALSISDKSMNNNNFRDEDRMVKDDGHSHGSNHHHHHCDMDNVIVLTTGSATNVYRERDSSSSGNRSYNRRVKSTLQSK